jgi:hypothetical protein
LQTTFGGSTDAFVTKLNAAGTALVYSTYLGGANPDVGFGIRVDSSGNAYVTGSTASPGFPILDPIPGNGTLGGGTGTSTDAFVTKLNVTGTGLVYSTYLGGAGEDVGKSIFVVSAGNAYVTGSTTSDAPNPFPTTAGAFQTTFGGTEDAFVAKIMPSGSSGGGTGTSDTGGSGGSGGGCFIATASAFEPRK